MKSLSLINYEGDCLKAFKNGEEILIQDQYGKDCKRLTIEEFYGFLVGLIDIIDSRGKSWNFPSEHPDAKPKPSQIFNFIH